MTKKLHSVYIIAYKVGVHFFLPLLIKLLQQCDLFLIDDVYLLKTRLINIFQIYESENETTKREMYLEIIPTSVKCAIMFSFEYNLLKI